MTNLEILVLVLACCIVLLIPKLGKQVRKWRKPIATRARLRRHNNVFKSYRRYAMDYQRANADKCRRENLAYYSPACVQLEETLRKLGIKYRREEIIWYDGDLFVLVDFWLPEFRIGIELDGKQHKGAVGYDAEKDQVVEEVTGFKIHRHWNKWALDPGLDRRVLNLVGSIAPVLHS